jgi:PhnB protein
VMHAELQIGDSRFFLGDEVPGMDCQRSPETLGGSPSGIYLYVRDVDEVFRKAVDAGATVKRPVEDMFWGDRTGSVLDPFGHTWDLATRREDVPPQEMKRRGEEFFRKMAGERK